MTQPPTPASPLEALKAGFRRACVRKLVGDEDGAVSVLRDEIPNLVVGWAKSTSLNPSEKKAKLKELFDDESGRADELSVAFDLFAGRFETRVSDLVKKEVNGLANRMETALHGLGSVVSQIEELTQKFNALDRAFSDEPTGAKSFNRKKASTTRTKNENLELVLDKDLSEGPVVDQKIIDPPKGDESSTSDEPDKEIVDSPKIQTVEDVPSNQLDPPSGTGLRFDEIEEMIDEILSYELK